MSQLDACRGGAFHIVSKVLCRKRKWKNARDYLLKCLFLLASDISVIYAALTLVLMKIHILF